MRQSGLVFKGLDAGADQLGRDVQGPGGGNRSQQRAGVGALAAGQGQRLQRAQHAFLGAGGQHHALCGVLAVELGNDKQPKADTTLNNGLKDVPSRLLTPIEVNKENIDATVIKDGFHKKSEL